MRVDGRYKQGVHVEEMMSEVTGLASLGWREDWKDKATVARDSTEYMEVHMIVL
jgi:hypothetical protein